MSTILSDETEAALERIAVRSGKSREQLANDALMSYIASYELEERKVAAACSAIDHGGSSEHGRLSAAGYAASPQEGTEEYDLPGEDQYEADFIRAVEAGRADVAAGRVMGHDEFFARWHAERPDGPRSHAE